MKINLHLSNETPAQNDKLFTLGWIEIIEDDKKISFFEDEICMLFLTLDSLFDFLFSKNNHMDWVGEDSGMVYNVKRNKENLLFTRKDFRFECNENEFKRALVRSLIEKCAKN